MKNLIPLTRHITYWDAIVAAKHNPSRTTLVGLRSSVAIRFRDYRTLCVPITLETITPSSFSGGDRTALLSCYSTSSNLSKLKAKIRSKQPAELGAECQYCNISEANTFDHYLPQESFSEFSALAQNLVPCCPTCNNKKDTSWLGVGSRTIINLYYDTLPTTTYLKCRITYRKGLPIAKYSIDQSAIPTSVRTLVLEHYRILGLLDRYHQLSPSWIMDILTSISTAEAKKLTRAQIENQLLQDATLTMTAKGPNYWRAICKIALANSPRFLTEAGY